MNKIIITKWQEQVLTCMIGPEGITQFQLEPKEEQSILGNIYIGKVKNIVKNINSAFIDLGSGLTAYYSLTENKTHHFTKSNPNGNGQLHEGDEIIVQVSKDAMKTKDPVVSSNLNFTGRYCVLTSAKTMIGFSGKITDAKWKEQIKKQILEVKEDSFGVIVRTNALTAFEDELMREIAVLKTQFQTLMQAAPYRTAYSLLYREVPAYVTGLRDCYQQEEQQVITDDPQIFEQLGHYLKLYQMEDSLELIYYQDPLVSLLKLYNLDRELSHALEKKVWLKSGGYLVIEPTEALVVIDVNTGKYTGKKHMDEAILKINLEAAQMIAKQLRLRNLSGIIIVDFIDMLRPEDKEKLLATLRALTANDPVKTTVLGMTQLNLVEITRKKIRKPLHEQLED